jgi:hypothetical protein
MSKQKIYTGSLGNRGDNMSAEAKRAYNIWNSQRSRCNNPRSASYKYYGAKGIRVQYTAREFIGWWLENIKKFKGERPSVSRLDHSKDYALSNIRMESISDNNRESALRTRPGAREIVAYDPRTGKLLATYKSIREASEKTGYSVTNICHTCVRNRGKQVPKITFKYSEDFHKEGI